MSNVMILGAGLAGLIAAAKFPDAPIIEASKSIKPHRALLRFRSPAIGELTGIPFKKVTVNKDACDHMGHSLPRPLSLAAINGYSLKVTNSLMSRSIRSLEESVRYIAPDDFHEQLAAKFASRIVYDKPFDLAMANNAMKDNIPVVSTIPLPVMLKVTGVASPDSPMKFSENSERPVYVARYKIDMDVDVYQTVYFPMPGMDIYRASITNGVLIVESTSEESLQLYGHIHKVLTAFGLCQGDIDFNTVTHHKLERGKIVELPKERRQAMLYRLTREFGIFSVGRYACWRNILLDDVLEDIDRVSDLIKASEYDRALRKV